MIDNAHHEKHFENYIVEKLKAQDWLVGTTAGYNIEHALYPEDLVAWLQKTQEDKWNKLVAANGAKATEVLMARLAQALEEKGTIHTLRRGFAIAGCGHIDLSEAEPEDKRNEKVKKRYDANRLRVVPQLKYHPAREFAIDLVFFFNGLAVATVEVKTDFTQSAEAAVEQYKNDRLPFDPKTKRREPLLTFQARRGRPFRDVGIRYPDGHQARWPEHLLPALQPGQGRPRRQSRTRRWRIPRCLLLGGRLPARCLDPHLPQLHLRREEGRRRPEGQLEQEGNPDLPALSSVVRGERHDRRCKGQWARSGLPVRAQCGFRQDLYHRLDNARPHQAASRRWQAVVRRSDHRHGPHRP
jgi:hypothetical protein